MDLLGDLFGSQKDATTIINQWRPRGCSIEKDYENSLVKYWRKVQPKAKVTPQFASGRTKVDIVIDGTIIVELKKDLKSTGQLQRLKGQLDDYAEWKGKVFVVLVGAVDPDIVSDLQEYVKKIRSADPLFPMFAEDTITIVRKS